MVYAVFGLFVLCPVGIVLFLSSKRKPHFKTLKNWREQNYDHGSQRDSKPRLPLLAGTSNNLPSRPNDRPTFWRPKVGISSIDWAQLNTRRPFSGDGGRVQSPKRCFDKNRMMNNFQKANNYMFWKLKHHR
jgi:hypothetical protein